MSKSTLSGLGQDEALTLEDPEQHYRIDDKCCIHKQGISFD